ncbi:hypothetical protein LHA35_09010, partial [Roseicella sp. GB24]|nr:hypothetical protein [Roseicella aerolata]
MNLNVLLRGQSNAVILGWLTDANNTKAIAAEVQRLLGFDGVTDTVTLLFEWSDPGGRNTAVGGTALIGDWLTRTTVDGQPSWQVNTLEKGLLDYIGALSSGQRDDPTVVLWLHSEYDSDGRHPDLTAAIWESAVRYDAGLVRAAFGSNDIPYIFVEPIPYVSGTNAGTQAIRLGMENLVADNSFNARLTAANDDLIMNAEWFGAGGHMAQSDAELVAGRAARSIAEAFAAYAKDGSVVKLANGNIADTGPIAIQAQQTGPRQVAVTLQFDGATKLAALDADAATGIGWSVISGSTVIKATGVALGAGNSLVVTFGADLPTGGTLHYGHGNAQLRADNGSVQGNAIYDDQGLPMRTPAAGLVIDAAPLQPGVTQAGTEGVDYLQAGTNGDTLIGGKGNDFLFGGAGADTFVFSLGDGFDWVAGFTPGVDRIKFNLGIAAAGVVVTPMTLEDVDGLGVIYDLNQDGLFLAGVSALQPGDIIYTPPPVGPSTIQGGSNGADTLAAGGGGDTLVGFKGADYLVGGSGKDVFVFSPGDGPDFVNDFTPGADKLLFAGGLTSGDVTSFQGSFFIGDLELTGLYVQYGSDDSQVFLNGVSALQPGDITFGSVPGDVEPVPSFTVVQGGTTTQVMATAYAGPMAGLRWQYTGSAAAEAVTGTGRNDHMAMGRGADTVRGGAGDDFL